VVVGQPTTAEWVERYGLRSVVADFWVVGFRSFWAQFGWMGVLVNDRIYVALFLLTAIALFGLGLWAWRAFRRRSLLSPLQMARAGLFALLFVLTFLEFVYYNLKFVQPQGRYLFPAALADCDLSRAGAA